MTTENKEEGKVEDLSEETGGEEEHDIEFYKSEAKRLEAEATKHRNIRKKAEKDRDELKKQLGSKKEDTQEDYKKLWTETKAENEKFLGDVKTASVNSVVSAKLSKMGVIPDAMEAALKLVDHKLIEWDRDAGVDESSVSAAMAKLKSAYPFMFEKQIRGNSVKTPADGNSNKESKTMTIEQYRSLQKNDPAQASKKFSEGWTIVG